MPSPQAANAVTHGLTARYHLQLGELPGKLKKVQRTAFALRRELEAAVMAARGSIDLLSAARIQTAVRLETTCQLARRWMTESLAELTEGERLAYLREIGRASVERDRVLRSLGLDGEPTTLDALYSVAPYDAPGDDESDGPTARPSAEPSDERSDRAADDASACDDAASDQAAGSTGTSSSAGEGAADAARDVQSPADSPQSIAPQHTSGADAMRASIAPL